MAVYLIEKLDRSSYQDIGDRQEQIRGILKAVDEDIAQLRSCHSLDEVKDAVWQVRDLGGYLEKIERDDDPFYFVYQVGTPIDYDGQSGEEYSSFEVMSWLLKELRACKKAFQGRLDQNQSYLNKIEDLKQEIESLENKYQLIDIVEKNEHLYYVFEPTELSHDACIRFVDDVVSAIHGKYWFTGRGGSWTVWSLKSDLGIEVNAGWTDSFSPYRDEEKWEVSFSTRLD